MTDNWRIPATLDRLISNIPAACFILEEQGDVNLAFQLRQDCKNLRYWQGAGGLVERAELDRLRGELTARDYAIRLAAQEMVTLQDEVARLRKENAKLIAALASMRAALRFDGWDGGELVEQGEDAR